MTIKTTNALLWTLSFAAPAAAQIFARNGWLAVALLGLSMMVTLAFEAVHTKWKKWAIASNVEEEPDSEPLFIKSIIAETATIAAIFYGSGVLVILSIRCIFLLGQLSDIGRFGQLSHPINNHDEPH